MPFDTKKKSVNEDFDPELEAEKAFDSLSIGSRRKKPAVSDEVEKTRKGGEANDETKDADVINVCSQSKHAVNFKEAKAARKKRSRGVSGSSIKKDGGRFKYGLDFCDDFDDVSGDEDDNMYVKDKHRSEALDSSERDESSIEGISDKSPHPENAIRLQKCLIEAINDPYTGNALHSISEVLTDFFDEKSRIEAIEMALDYMVTRDEWTRRGAIDRLAEYKAVCVLAKVIDQGLISPKVFNVHCKSNSAESHSLRLMHSAIGFFQKETLELLGARMEAPPKEYTDIAEDLCRSGEVNCVREALLGSPFFHTDVIYQVCYRSVNSMNMDVIFNASKTFKDLISEKIMASTAVNAGVFRFLTELQDIEVDLPAVSSLAFLLVSYCIEDPACIDYNIYMKCPRPHKFLRKRTASSGLLSIPDDPDENCNVTNYFQSET